MAYEETYQKFSTENIFTGRINMDGEIFTTNMRGLGSKVGIDVEREQELLKQIEEMQGVIDNYYQKLVDLGAIEVPKTSEQIAQEQAEQQAIINQQLLEAIGALNAEVKELRANGNDGCSIESNIGKQENDSKSNRSVSTANRRSNKSSKTDGTSNSE